MSFDVRIQREEPFEIEEWLRAATRHPALRVATGEPVRIDQSDVPLFFTPGVGVHSPDSEDDTIRVLLELADALQADVIDDELHRYLPDPDTGLGYRVEDADITEDTMDTWDPMDAEWTSPTPVPSVRRTRDWWQRLFQRAR